MIKDVILTIPLVDQGKHVKDKKWKKNSCAVCSMKMMMGFRNRNHLEIPIGQLIQEAHRMGGYIEKVGWRHKVIRDLARKYKVQLNYIKEFPKTLEDKSKWLKKLEKSVIGGRPVMASLHYKLSKKNGGHIVVINGIRTKDKLVLGYHIQDPDSRFRGNNYYIAKDKFLLGWRGGMIFFSK